MGFYPVEVLVNDAKRHGVAVLPVDINASRVQDDDRVGRPAGLGDRRRGGDDGSHDGDPGEPLPDGAASSPAAAGPLVGLRHPVGRGARAVGGRERDRLGRPPRAAARQGDRRGARGALDAELARGPYRASRTSSSGRACRRRSSSGSSGPARSTRWAGRGASCCGSCARSPARHGAGRRADGRIGGGRRSGPPDGRWTCACRRRAAPPLPAIDRDGAAGRCLRGRRARCPAPGRGAVPAGARAARGGDERGARRDAAGAGADRRAGGHAAAPDDRARDGVPGARGRDRHGQRHALAGHLGSGCGASSAGTRCCWSTGSSSARRAW